MYQCSKKLATHKGCSCFDQSDFPAHSMFTFDVCWGSLGTSIFGNCITLLVPPRFVFSCACVCFKHSYHTTIFVKNLWSATETTELKKWLEETLDACANEGGTNNVLENSSSAANNTRSKLPSTLSFRFLWLW